MQNNKLKSKYRIYKLLFSYLELNKLKMPGEIESNLQTGRQKIAILIRMQFLNDIIKSKHGSKIS